MHRFTNRSREKTRECSVGAEQQKQVVGAAEHEDNRLGTTAQRKLIAAIQRQADDEELLQGQFATAQRVEGDEELLQGKFETAQRVEKNEELLQGKFETVQRAGPEDEELTQGKFEGDVAQRKPEAQPNNTGLPDNLKAGIENLSGYSMDDVKVHYNSDKPSQLNAHAYAQGTDIHVASGQEKHLPHEAWHIVQQKQGRVKPTMQMKQGVPVNDDIGLEKEADVMGAKASDVGMVGGISRTVQLNAAMHNVIQCTLLSDATGQLDAHANEYDDMRSKYDAEEHVVDGIDPDGDEAEGLLHWATETFRSAQREYNELHAVIKEGGAAGGARLGKNNLTEPDVVKGAGLIEVKTNDTANASDVDALVNDALYQLWARRAHYTNPLSVYVYLEDGGNMWPYVATDHADPAADFTPAKLRARLKLRGVGWPAYGAAWVNYRVYYSADDGTGSNIGYKDFRGKLNGT